MLVSCHFRFSEQCSQWTVYAALRHQCVDSEEDGEGSGQRLILGQQCSDCVCFFISLIVHLHPCFMQYFCKPQSVWADPLEDSERNREWGWICLKWSCRSSWSKRKPAVAHNHVPSAVYLLHNQPRLPAHSYQCSPESTPVWRFEIIVTR